MKLIDKNKVLEIIDRHKNVRLPIHAILTEINALPVIGDETLQTKIHSRMVRWDAIYRDAIRHRDKEEEKIALDILAELKGLLPPAPTK